MTDKDFRTESSLGWNIEHDLRDILEATQDVWDSLKGATLFLTGGTGFVGTWLLESLKWADQKLKLGLHVTILTRNKAQFQKKALHLASYPSFTFIEGDVRTFASPRGAFTYVIHAATDARQSLNDDDPRQMFDTIVSGTLRVLDFAVEKQAEKVLHLSSGAVYGPQPDGIRRVGEDLIGLLDFSNPGFAYSEGKRGAEMLCAIFEKQFSLKVAIARIFAVVGPYLPLEEHFVVGNFIRDAIDGRRIQVKGNGSPVRSYLYASDMVIWLWRLLQDGRPGVRYNLGSENEVSIQDLARIVSSVVGNGNYEIQGKPDIGVNPGRYVPDTTRITTELGLDERVTLQEGIRRTALWNGWKGIV